MLVIRLLTILVLVRVSGSISVADKGITDTKRLKDRKSLKGYYVSKNKNYIMLASIHDILNMDPYNSIERRIEKDFNSKVLAN